MARKVNGWESEDEIRKVYEDHIESLHMWGGPCNIDDVREAMEDEIKHYREALDRH